MPRPLYMHDSIGVPRRRLHASIRRDQSGKQWGCLCHTRATSLASSTARSGWCRVALWPLVARLANLAGDEVVEAGAALLSTIAGCAVDPDTSGGALKAVGSLETPGTGSARVTIHAIIARKPDGTTGP